MFRVPRLSFFIALVIPSSVRSETVEIRVASKHNPGEEWCLAIRPDVLNASSNTISHVNSTNSSSWNVDGVPIALRLCGTDMSSECGGDFSGTFNCGLSRLWQIDALGSVVSHVSGKCLVDDLSGPIQMLCKSAQKVAWHIRSDGGLESRAKPGQCLAPKSVQPMNGTSWRALEVRPCTEKPVAWRTEAVNLVTYPVVSGWENYGSPWYEVTVSQANSRDLDSFVYYMQPFEGQPLQGHSNSYTTFSFKGLARVTVKRYSGKFNNVVLRPLSLNLVHEVLDDSTIQFFVNSPGGKISVEFDDDWVTDPLLIFADPLETDVPAQWDSDVIYFEPGEHTVDNPVMLTSGQKVYIAGGAVLFAGNSKENMFDSGSDSSLSNIQITGRGIISGKLSDGHPYLVTLCGNDHVVDGITMVMAPQQSHLQINAPWYCDGGFSGVAGGAKVHNVKLMSWNFADGIYAGARSLVSRSFTKVNDDGVKPFESGAVCEHNVHWQQGNGWAIMIAWLTEGHQSNIRVSDSTILHDGHTLDSDFPVAGCDPCYSNQASIGAVHGGSGTISNVLIENIVMETQVLRPVWIGIDKSVWGTTGAGAISNFKLSNIRVLGSSLADSQVVSTFDDNQVSGVEFHNFEVWGRVASSVEDAYVEVIPSNLDVSVTAKSPSPPPTSPGAPFIFQLRRDHSKCLDMSGGVPAKGTWVELWECNGLVSQQWLWDADAHTIQSAAHTSLCLDIPGGDTSSDHLWLWECNGSVNQIWDYDSASGGIFHFTDNDDAVCLDLPDGLEAMGASLQLYTCTGWVQQSWDQAPTTVVV